jgi:hypothetical protein
MTGNGARARLERTADTQPDPLSGRSDQPIIADRSTGMYFIHEQLARERARTMHEEGRRSRQASRLVTARRWQRRAERANMRARLARAAVV